MTAITKVKEHIEAAKRLTGDAYLGADMNKECDKAYSELCKALKLLDGIPDRDDDSVVMTETEWENMVNQQECMQAEIDDCNEEVAGLKALMANMKIALLAVNSCASIKALSDLEKAGI